MKIYGKTDIGKVRNINQDNYFYEILENDIALLCVCDGMGGTNGGQIASSNAGNEFILEIKRQLKNELTTENIREILTSAINSANTHVYEMSQNDKELSEMGTTLIGGILYKNCIYIANIGDSRCYHISDDCITQVTKDHSLVQELIDKEQITYVESLNHPDKKYITRAVGTHKNVSGDIYKINLEKNEQILLCSDGLHNMMDEVIIKQKMSTNDDVKKKCLNLINIANKNGGHDNITAVILEF